MAHPVCEEEQKAVQRQKHRHTGERPQPGGPGLKQKGRNHGQGSQKKQKGQTNYVERIAVLSVDLRGWCQEGGNDVLVARLKTRIVDYTLDDATGSLVSGDRNKEKFMTYEWDLVRPTGTKTEAGGNMQTVSCPHCGAPLEINASAKCPYCGSVITLEEHGFALNAIRAISQETRG